MFMNEHEINDNAAHYRDHPVLGPATQTLANLMEWANRNSDGWAYWPKPARAAKNLMDLIHGERPNLPAERADATPEKLAAALRPIKAFRTRQGSTMRVDFEIVEYDPIAARLEYLRSQIRGECISYSEIAELQGLAEHIKPGDVELLEWAGVPEHPADTPTGLTDLGETLAPFQGGTIVLAGHGCPRCGHGFWTENDPARHVDPDDLVCPRCAANDD